MANTSYSRKIIELLKDMPPFVEDFIFNFGDPQSFSTKLEYCRDIKTYLEFLINFTSTYDGYEMKDFTLNDLENVDILDINKYFTYLLGDGNEGLKETTVKRRRASISSLYGYYANAGKISKNPILGSKKINVPEKELIYLSTEQQNKLLEAIEYGTNLTGKAAKLHEDYVLRDKAIFLLLLDTGLRVSEMLNTNVIDYNLSDCYVIVRRKGGDADMVYFSDECRECLNEHFSYQREKLRIADDKMPAFASRLGDRLSSRAVERLVKKYVEACMPELTALITPHKLRSSFAMSFYEASDNNILLLQKKLHHKSITTTNIYAKASKKEEEASRNLLSLKRESIS